MSIDLESNIRENLAGLMHMSLASVRDGKPWVCEVHFAHDDELNIYYRSSPTRRHSLEIAEHPYVAGNMVKQYQLGETCTAVYFEGEAKLLETDADRQAACAVMQAKLGVADDALAEAKRSGGTQFYKITVHNFAFYGQFGDTKAQKYEMAWPKA